VLLNKKDYFEKKVQILQELPMLKEYPKNEFKLIDQGKGDWKLADNGLFNIWKIEGRKHIDIKAICD